MPKQTALSDNLAWLCVYKLNLEGLKTLLRSNPSIAWSRSETHFHPTGPAMFGLWLYYRAMSMPAYYAYRKTKNPETLKDYLGGLALECSVSLSTLLLAKMPLGTLSTFSAFVSIANMCGFTCGAVESAPYEKIVFPDMTLLEYALSTCWDIANRAQILELIEVLMMVGNREDNIQLLEKYCSSLIDPKRHIQDSHLIEPRYIELCGKQFKFQRIEVLATSSTRRHLDANRNQLHKSLKDIITKAKNGTLDSLLTPDQTVKDAEIERLEREKSQLEEKIENLTSTHSNALALFTRENEKLSKDFRERVRSLESTISNLKQEHDEMEQRFLDEDPKESHSSFMR